MREITLLNELHQLGLKQIANHGLPSKAQNTWLQSKKSKSSALRRILTLHGVRPSPGAAALNKQTGLASTNLATSNWAYAGTMELTNGIWRFGDTNTAGLDERYYRRISCASLLSDTG